MNTCDIREVEPGILFQLVAPIQDWWNKYLGYGVSNTFSMDAKGSMFIHSPEPAPLYGMTRNDPRFGKQQVQPYKHLDEIPLDKKMGTIGYRINNSTGTDPEIFVVDTADVIIPAFRFLPEQKAAKYQVGDSIYGAYAYRDGFAAECYVKAGGCHGYLIDRIRQGLQSVLTAARKFDSKAKLSTQSTVIIPSEIMSAAADEEIALGCTPSMSAYDDFPEMPNNARELPIRSAGGHVHLGVNKKTALAATKQIIKGCDLIAGVAGVGIFAATDTPARRQTYGRAGEYRIPAHGLEYRTLSNGWLIAPHVAHLMLSLTRCGGKMGFANITAKDFGLSDERVREIINFCDVIAARKILEEHAEVYEKLMYFDGISADPGKTHAAWMAITQEGIEKLFPLDVAKNWKLDSGWGGHSDNSRATWGAVCQLKY